MYTYYLFICIYIFGPTYYIVDLLLLFDGSGPLCNGVDAFFVVGKSGKRRIQLNKQAVSVLDEIDSLWEYRPTYITRTFKKNLRRLGIKNGRLHDLRRTFGYNLIKQGMPIYQLSKLLGHSSVTTTEKHYAPLLATDIEEFIL